VDSVAGDCGGDKNVREKKQGGDMNANDELIVMIGTIIVGVVLFFLGRDSMREEGRKLEERVAALEALCELADVPPMLIQNPDMFNGEITDKDREWAKKAIKEYKNTKP
jgi:hypothetical protein